MNYQITVFLKQEFEVKSMIFEYIEIFYNNKRKHLYLGYCSPNQF